MKNTSKRSNVRIKILKSNGIPRKSIFLKNDFFPRWKRSTSEKTNRFLSSQKYFYECFEKYFR